MSIKVKIILATTIVLGIGFTSFSYIIYQKAKAAYWGSLDAKLQGYASTFREEVDEQSHEHRFPTVSDFRDLKSKGLAGSMFRLLDEKGNIIVDDSLLDSRTSAPFGQLLQHDPGFQDISLNGEPYRSLWTSMNAESGGRYLLQILLPSSEVEAALHLLQLLFLVGVPIALVLSGVAVFAIVVGAFRPLSAVARTANTVSATNLRERIALPRHRDEVLTLASTFNKMMDRIERAFASQKQFVADASHEIRTPLTIIRSELEFSRKKISDETVLESIDTALDEVERLKILSDNLLTLARIDSSSIVLERSEVRLDELLADCARKMKTVSEKRNVTLVVRIAEVRTIHADEEKLCRAILNLVDNALKYSHAGGAVTISTRAAGDHIEIIVCDEGEGISGEELGIIFERFHTTGTQRAKREGSGLGLAIVRGIVELHNGSVTVTSEPGKGSVFTISLPVGRVA